MLQLSGTYIRRHLVGSATSGGKVLLGADLQAHQGLVWVHTVVCDSRLQMQVKPREVEIAPAGEPGIAHSDKQFGSPTGSINGRLAWLCGAQQPGHIQAGWLNLWHCRPSLLGYALRRSSSCCATPCQDGDLLVAVRLAGV
jgi:hypothetical protein